MIYGWIIGGLAALDLGVKSVVEGQEDDTFPRELPSAKGFIKLHKNHNSGFPFGFMKERPEWGGDFGRYFGESAGTTRVVMEENLFPAIEGMDPFDIDLIHHKMDLAIRGYNYAKAAIDIALYDMMGKAVEKPVYQLLGGQHRKAIPIAHSLGVVMDIDAAVEEAVAACKEGIKNIKMKGGLNLVRDVELMQKLRGNLRMF